MAGETKHRDPITGLLAAKAEPDVEFEIRVAADKEARQLGMQQVRVFREVTQWLVRNRSALGPDDPAQPAA